MLKITLLAAALGGAPLVWLWHLASLAGL